MYCTVRVGHYSRVQYIVRSQIGPAIQDEFRKSVITLVTGKVDNGGATDKNSFNQAFLPLQFNVRGCLLVCARAKERKG